MRTVTSIMMAATFVAITSQHAIGSNQKAITSTRTFGAWQVVCGSAPGERHRCSMLQQQAASSAGQAQQRLLAIELQPSQDIVRGTIILPFGLDLSRGAKLSLGGIEGEMLPFKTCLPAGCVVDVSFGAESLSALSKADTLDVIVVPLQHDGLGNLKVLLDGFPDALEAARQDDLNK